MDPKIYLLRIADDNGKADEDYPALDEKQLIQKFKGENFVLSRIPNKQTETPPPMRNGSFVGHSRNLSFGGNPNIPVIKVNLPDNSSTKIHVTMETKISDLLKTVCRKRHYHDHEHYLSISPSLGAADSNMTMDKLDLAELTLVPKSLARRSTLMGAEELRRSGPDDLTSYKTSFRKSVGTLRGGEPYSPDLEEIPEIIWHDTIAFAYKSYEVYNRKKSHLPNPLLVPSESVMLGIDKERIEITNTSAGTNTPARLIREVTKAFVGDKRPFKEFTIEYIDGKALVFEAKTRQDAYEIVSKIEYLVKLQQQQAEVK
eukprot:TRINITY_DN3015_c0_g1_i3.p1 TRINITY_DN3015_c0_g1~~TRINITY_DN3015_c0_g1_i3.p1  ORF type:complete len:315 (+),score=74.83 TRINITY_DN3015_c0_g1_i3:198-1142(+)